MKLTKDAGLLRILAGIHGKGRDLLRRTTMDLYQIRSIPLWHLRHQHWHQLQYQWKFLDLFKTQWTSQTPHSHYPKRKTNYCRKHRRPTHDHSCLALTIFGYYSSRINNTRGSKKQKSLTLFSPRETSIISICRQTTEGFQSLGLEIVSLVRQGSALVPIQQSMLRAM
jgi:hypothetical protein